MRNGLVTRKEDEFAKQTQVMLLGGWFADDMTAVEYPVSIQLEARTQALLVEKGASNLQSNFPLGLGYECAFLNLPVPAATATTSDLLDRRWITCLETRAPEACAGCGPF